MKIRRILFTEPFVAKLVEKELPEPGYGQVQVRLAFSTVSSGTERAKLTGSRSCGWTNPEAETAIFPREGGYSSSGVVTALGEDVTDLQVGDRVAMFWTTHSEIVNISRENVYLLDGVSFEDGALFHIATFPLAAMRKCHLELGESAIVMGMGILGLMSLPLLRAAGACPIIAVDPDPTKREKALSHGADYALDPFDPLFAQKAKELTGGGAKVGIEVTGIGKGLEGILDCMARGGRVALLGCTRNADFTIDYYRKVHGPGITLIGAHTHARPQQDSYSGWWTQKDDMEALIRLTKSGRLRLSSMIEETHSPEETPAVYHRLAQDKTFPIVQFCWGNHKK
ncbi:MAG: theronine dehydrogenase [Ruminococcaceae bacterium]|nr:theronine dehydrogenase [Oscillospiraceae bacterium]